MRERPSLLSKLACSALDLVFPIHCAGCGREGAIVCAVCAPALPALARPYCHSCAAPSVDGLCRSCLAQPPGFDAVRSPYRFEGAVREAIHALKYRGVRAAAGTLAGLMSQFLEENPFDADFAVPVPLHHRRLNRRGYNQSALLAREIDKRLNLPVREDLLTRVKNSRPQVEAQSAQERRSNVAGNFRCHADASGLTVLLIDDVATTGSTLSECALALKAAGAVRVHGLTLAREG